jgi:hypothetical protein
MRNEAAQELSSRRLFFEDGWSASKLSMSHTQSQSHSLPHIASSSAFAPPTPPDSPVELPSSHSLSLSWMRVQHLGNMRVDSPDGESTTCSAASTCGDADLFDSATSTSSPQSSSASSSPAPHQTRKPVSHSAYEPISLVLPPRVRNRSTRGSKPASRHVAAAQYGVKNIVHTHGNTSPASRRLLRP